jgi:hypothetical protein
MSALPGLARQLPTCDRPLQANSESTRLYACQPRPRGSGLRAPAQPKRSRQGTMAWLLATRSAQIAPMRSVLCGSSPAQAQPSSMFSAHSPSMRSCGTISGIASCFRSRKGLRSVSIPLPPPVPRPRDRVPPRQRGDRPPATHPTQSWPAARQVCHNAGLAAGLEGSGFS